MKSFCAILIPFFLVQVSYAQYLTGSSYSGKRFFIRFVVCSVNHDNDDDDDFVFRYLLVQTKAGGFRTFGVATSTCDCIGCSRQSIQYQQTWYPPAAVCSGNSRPYANSINVQAADSSTEFRVYTSEGSLFWPNGKFYKTGSSMILTYDSVTCFNAHFRGGYTTALIGSYSLFFTVYCDTPTGCTFNWNIDTGCTVDYVTPTVTASTTDPCISGCDPAGGLCNYASATCSCFDGKTGSRCQFQDLCYNVFCGSHGSCNSTSYTCTCTDGYTGNQCQNHPIDCPTGQTCINNTCYSNTIPTGISCLRTSSAPTLTSTPSIDSGSTESTSNSISNLPLIIGSSVASLALCILIVMLVFCFIKKRNVKSPQNVPMSVNNTRSSIVDLEGDVQVKAPQLYNEYQPPPKYAPDIAPPEYDKPSVQTVHDLNKEHNYTTHDVVVHIEAENELEKRPTPCSANESVKRDNLMIWLNSHQLTYCSNFLLNAGYNDLEIVLSMDEAEVKSLGIDKPGLQKKLIMSIYQCKTIMP